MTQTNVLIKVIGLQRNGTQYLSQTPLVGDDTDQHSDRSLEVVRVWGLQNESIHIHKKKSFTI